MPDLIRTQNFVDGDLVTALKLKNLIDQTNIDPSFVSRQNELQSTTVDVNNDTVLVHDASAILLKKVRVRELLRVPITLTTLSATTVKSSIFDAEANKGMLLTANNGVSVTGRNWVSSNGTLVTVTSTAHGLTTGAVLSITANNAAYSADTAITVTSADSFTYTLPASVSNVAWTSSVITATPPAYNQALITVTSPAHGLTTGTAVTTTASDPNYSGASVTITVLNANQFTYTLSSFPPSRPASSGILSYTPARLASAGTLSYVQIGFAVVNGRFRVSGNTELAGTRVSGDLSVTGNAAIEGTSRFAGATSFLAPATFYNDVKVRGVDIKPRFDYFVQTRTQSVLTSTWGGAQNPANSLGTKIPTLDLTFTPQKAGNRVVLTWTLFAEFTALDKAVLFVTRTPNTGAGAGVAVPLPDSVDASNNTWSGVAVPHWSQDESSTPELTTIRIVDNNSLDVNCTYSLHFRASNNIIVTAYINRAAGSAGALIFESGMSLGHAHEIST
jgi:hypothetical protein